MRSTLALLKDQRQASEILNRRRLPIERLPSRLPLREGFAALIWKSVAHLSRTFTFSSFLQWMTIAAAWAGIWVLGDPISKAFTALLWVMLVEDQISRSLQEDLYQWRIFGLLPLPARSLVVGEIAASSLICILASCLGNGVVGFIAPSPLQGWVYGLIPGLVFCTACIGVFDISRRTHTGQLVAEQIQSVEMVGVLLGGVGMGITLYPAYWLITNGFPYGTGFLLTLIIQGLLAAIVLGIASQQYRQIRTRP
jgi:hypothetical protein